MTRGDGPPPAEPAHDPAPEPPRGLLRTLFPPAPPLPSRPDPLAGFDRQGPLRPLRERWFLLRSNLPAWTLPAILALVGYVGSRLYAQGILGFVGMFLLFGGLIAAGWYGWQRPTLYGTAAGLVAFVLATSFVLVYFAGLGISPETFTGAELLAILVEALYLVGLGFVGGWYGGYLRRRQAALAPPAPRRRR